MTILTTLANKGLITPPKFIHSNMHYLCRTGSVTYGVSSDCSDNDAVGFCIPHKDTVYPHLNGHIQGFGQKPNIFNQWQQHHVIDNETKKSWDFCIYSIVRYFDLCLGNNPNMIDSLFVRRNHILYISSIGEKVRENRKIFLSKLVWPKFKGYAYSQLNKMRVKTPVDGSNRRKSYEKYGYDVKFAYHCVRLLDEVEQILTEGDLDLHRASEVLKSIRRGEWKQEKVFDYFNNKEKDLESVYLKSDLPYKPDEEAIKNLLIECLDQHFGFSHINISMKEQQTALQKIQEICNKELG